MCWLACTIEKHVKVIRYIPDAENKCSRRDYGGQDKTEIPDCLHGSGGKSAVPGAVAHTNVGEVVGSVTVTVVE